MLSLARQNLTCDMMFVISISVGQKIDKKINVRL